MAIAALTVTKTGDRSFSAAFTSGAPADVLTFAAIAAGLPGVSAIESFIAATPNLAAFATRGASCSLLSAPTVAGTASFVEFDATGFKGFAAGSHVLRVSLAAAITA